MTSLRSIRPPKEPLSFKTFFELMAVKVNEILLVSSPYDAFIMEEDGRLAQRIIQEYQGLNLSRPPRVTWVSTAQEALAALARTPFDIVITMPRVDDMDAFDFGHSVKQTHPALPVFLLTHNTNSVIVNQLNARCADQEAIDRVFVWNGNSDLFLALIKNVEDRLNVAHDTARAQVRVVLLVEDSPIYRSLLLPLLYKEIVSQTQSIISSSLNEDHRILRMRARPKILLAQNYQEAVELYQQVKPYLLTVFSDVRFPRDGQMDAEAGFALLKMIRADSPEVPLMMLSTEAKHRERALDLPAVFLDKNAPSMGREIREFFVNHLGFGDFVFRRPDGREVARAANLREMERVLPQVSEESVLYHARRNDFSTWLMARCEIRLASYLRPLQAGDFESAHSLKAYLIACIQDRRRRRQRGIITEFSPRTYDPDMEFLKLGKGSLGGKARGLAFLSTLCRENDELADQFPEVDIIIPQTVVLGTEWFDLFMERSALGAKDYSALSDGDIAREFLAAEFPQELRQNLGLLLSHVTHPLAVRSSSLLEDAQFRPCAGLYNTYMLPNNHPDPEVRLSQLIQAIQLVYASTFQAPARAFAQSSLHRTEAEKMAVIIQKLTGQAHDGYFYPAIGGVAQSHNFYPIGRMRPEDGVVHVALGLGRMVVEGGHALRFAPPYPQLMPHFSTVEDILNNAQRHFYALRMEAPDPPPSVMATESIVRLSVDDAAHHPPVKFLSSSYDPVDHRIREGAGSRGYPVVTMARILKYELFPLAAILTRILALGRRGMAGPVEVEFAVNPALREGQRATFALLQIRPMALCQANLQVTVSPEEIATAKLYSDMAMGGSSMAPVTDIVYVDPETFDPARTQAIAGEIRGINQTLAAAQRKYLLIGPGRWGSADRWLGIPVIWDDISAVSTIVETAFANFRADPSQGSHFFHNITSLGINYLTLGAARNGRLDWSWLKAFPVVQQSEHVKHAHLLIPATLKVDGQQSLAVLMA